MLAMMRGMDFVFSLTLVVAVLVSSCQALVIYTGAVSCYGYGDGCSADQLIAVASTTRECCLGDGYWYQSDGSLECVQCRVHGFEQTIFAAKEGETLNVPLRNALKGPLTDLTCRIYAFGRTASSNDYVTRFDVGTNFPLQSTNLTVHLSNDAYFEGNETFQLSILCDPGHYQNEIIINTAIVTIIDATIFAGFENELYTTTEGGGAVDVCVLLSESSTPLHPLQVTLTTEDSSATSPGDYQGRTESLRLSNTDRRACVSIPITDDTVPEIPEYFTVVLSTVDPNVFFHPGNATVTINDVDGFENELYTTTEGGGSVDVCVLLSESSTPLHPLQVTLTTVDSSATSPGDYQGRTESLRLSNTDRRVCVSVPITDDTVPEIPQNFTVVLSTVEANLFLSLGNATVTIHDDDVAPEPEKGCTVEIFVLAANQEEREEEVVDTIQTAFPSIFGVSMEEKNASTTEPLISIYTTLAEEFDDEASDAGYSQFVEAVTEITEAHVEACSGPAEARPQLEDVPELARQFEALHSEGTDLQERRRIFGKLLCLKDQADSSDRKRRQVRPEGCSCPEGGLSGTIRLVCEVFDCLDPDDHLKPLFGFDDNQGQALGFVVDTTGSMGDEIEAAKKVMTSLIAREENVDLWYYALMPFNDYDDVLERSVGPLTVADSLQAGDVQGLVSAITALYADGGGDCAEYALNAILDTLRASYTDSYGETTDVMAPGSQIVVLTDAPSKNPHLEDDVIREANSRRVCIHFIISETGCIDSADDREGYENIAMETGGTVIDSLRNSDPLAALNEFVDYYETSPCHDHYPDVTPGKRKKRAAASADPFSVERRQHSFKVSSLTSVLKLIVRTSQAQVTIQKPSGFITILDIVNQFASYFDENPESGEWSVSVGVGTLAIVVNPQVTLDVVVSYLIEDADSPTATPEPPPACSNTKIAVITSRVSDISTASLLLTDSNGDTVDSIPLEKCSEFLIGNLTSTPSSITYYIQGEDTDGIPFAAYKTRQTATFGPGSYSFTTIGETNVEVNISETFQLSYQFQNLNYVQMTLSFTADQVDGFYTSIQPQSSVIPPGDSVQVTLSANVISSRVVHGNSYVFTATAADGCTTITSEPYTVTVQAPPTTPPPPDACGCQNGGTCIIIRRGRVEIPRCRCPSGYGGSKCQIVY